MTEDKRDVFIGTEIGEPVPGEYTFSADDDVVAVRLDCFEKTLRFRMHVAVQDQLPRIAQDAEIHGTGVEIDTAVEPVFFGVKSHRGLLSGKGLMTSQHTTPLC